MRGKRVRPISPVKVIFGAFLLLFLVGAVGLAASTLKLERERAAFETLAALPTAPPATAPPQALPAPSAPAAAPTEDPRVRRFQRLAERNPDFAAWLTVPETGINYPVMSTPEEPEYYLHRAFDKAYSISGTPFLGEGCALESDNAIVYGHNMKNGTMFSDLTKYKSEDYWRAHPAVTLQTGDEIGEYTVLAAFETEVYAENAKNVFRYYRYGGDLTEEEFNAYLAGVGAAALYDTGVTAQYGDKLLTLSTCAYHTQNGRFVVVAKKGEG